mmetsp:Transcript_27036/g.59874  ORF Transcript_27036/g.59874 Transcript_27036/m.59874 type:complete len:121 (+) Transcript_27036:511-873(+)
MAPPGAGPPAGGPMPVTEGTFTLGINALPSAPKAAETGFGLLSVLAAPAPGAGAAPKGSVSVGAAIGLAGAGLVAEPGGDVPPNGSSVISGIGAAPNGSSLGVVADGGGTAPNGSSAGVV